MGCFHVRTTLMVSVSLVQMSLGAASAAHHLPLLVGAGETAESPKAGNDSHAVVVAPTEASLRAAILGGASNIQFAADGVVPLSQTIDVPWDLTIDGTGRMVTFSGENAVRLFSVPAGVCLNLRNVNLANGYSTNAGAILNDGILTLEGCTFSNNIARGVDGTNGADGAKGAPGDNGGPGTSAIGGAILTRGTLLISNCLFTANGAIGGSGGAGGRGGHTVYSSQFLESGGNGGDGAAGEGGAIWNVGSMSVFATRFEQNLARGGRGGNGGEGGRSWQGLEGGLPGRGGNARSGGLHNNATAVVEHCSFLLNGTQAGFGGAAGVAADDPSAGLPGRNGGDGGQSAGGALSSLHHLELRDTYFHTNTARAGDGGPGGRGGRGDFSSGGSSGGAGGPGGHALGGAAWASNVVELTDCSLDGNKAMAGLGGDGGNGGDNSSNSSGESGRGGHGAAGGDAFGGGLAIRSLTVIATGNRWRGNVTHAGDGGAGGDAGAPFSRFNGGGEGGYGGSAGRAAGGALFLESASALLDDSWLELNIARAGNAGAGGNGASTWSGFATSESGGTGGLGRDGGEAEGGGVFASGNLLLSRATLFGNSSVAGVGGQGGAGGTSKTSAGSAGAAGRGGTAMGGGAFSGGFLISIASRFLSNSASGGLAGRGGIGGNVYGFTFSSTLQYGAGTEGGWGGHAYGGGLFGAQLLFSCSIASANVAMAGGGGRAGLNGGSADGFGSSIGSYGVSPLGGRGGMAFGGALAGRRDLVIEFSELSVNTALGGVSGATGPGGFHYFDYGMGGGSPARPGSNGGPAGGGAIYIAAGDNRILSSTFDRNLALAGVGGLGGDRYQPSDTNGGFGGTGGTAQGGAVLLQDGFLALTNVTFYSNCVAGGTGGTGGTNNGGARGGSGGGAFGGAIHSSTGAVVLVNGSFSENLSMPGLGGYGGTGGTNSTGPSGLTGGAFGGTLRNDAAQFSIVNSLFQHGRGSANASGSFSDSGNNLSSDASFAYTHTASRNSLDPLIGTLTDNGGATRTMGLLSGSPAIDSGEDAAAPAVDQRGVLRPFGLRSDIGAFELDEPVFTLSGRVWRGSLGVPNIPITAGLASISTGPDGSYAIRNLFGGSYVVAPQFQAAEFAPASRQVTVGPDTTGVDFEVTLSRVSTTWKPGSGGPSILFSGVRRASYNLESSTNLMEWSVVTNAQMDAHGFFLFDRLMNANEPERYFRAR